MSKIAVYKRTFEASKHEKGSAERIRLNESVITSEYYNSHKYALVGKNFTRSFRTKKEATEYMLKNCLREIIEQSIIRQKITPCYGGGIEISLDDLGWPQVRMTAYQNYLGGGLLGRICNSCTIRDWESDPALCDIAYELRKYMHELTNPPALDEDGEKVWESQTFEQNQNMPVSAY